MAPPGSASRVGGAQAELSPGCRDSAEPPRPAQPEASEEAFWRKRCKASLPPRTRCIIIGAGHSGLPTPMLSRDSIFMITRGHEPMKYFAYRKHKKSRAHDMQSAFPKLHSSKAGLDFKPKYFSVEYHQGNSSRHGRSGKQFSRID